MTKIYIIIFLFITYIINIIKPIWGVYLYNIFLFTDPTIFAKEFFETYRPALIAAVLLVIGTLIRGYNFSQLKFVFSTLLLIFIVFLSILFGGGLNLILSEGKISNESLDSFISILKMVSYAIIIIWSITKRNELITLLNFITFCSTANGLFAIYEFFHPIAERAKFTTLYRSSGFQENSNGLSVLLTISIPIAYYFFINEKNIMLKSLYLICILSMICGIFLSISRTGLLTLVVIMGLIIYKTIKKQKNTIFLFLIIIMVVSIFFITFAKKLYMERETVTTTLSGRTVYDNSTTTRLKLMKYAFQLWLYHPLLGVGLDNFRESAKNELSIKSRVVPHTAYLKLLCETGTLGFLSFIFIFIQSFKKLKHIRKKDFFYNELVDYFQIILISWCINLFFSTTIFVQIFWITISLPFILENISIFENENSVTT